MKKVPRLGVFTKLLAKNDFDESKRSNATEGSNSGGQFRFYGGNDGGRGFTTKNTGKIARLGTESIKGTGTLVTINQIMQITGDVSLTAARYNLQSNRSYT